MGSWVFINNPLGLFRNAPEGKIPPLGGILSRVGLTRIRTREVDMSFSSWPSSSTQLLQEERSSDDSSLLLLHQHLCWHLASGANRPKVETLRSKAAASTHLG